jgi:hypothetical protein
MFQLFSNPSSTNNSNQAALRMNDNRLGEKAALSDERDERPATYEEMLRCLLLGAMVGF